MCLFLASLGISPDQGIKPTPSSVKTWSLIHGTTREDPNQRFVKSVYSLEICCFRTKHALSQWFNQRVWQQSGNILGGKKYSHWLAQDRWHTAGSRGYLRTQILSTLFFTGRLSKIKNMEAYVKNPSVRGISRNAKNEIWEQNHSLKLIHKLNRSQGK